MSENPAKSQVTPLSDDERMEYTEIGQFYRHDDSIAYQLASILLPLSFGAVALAAQFPKMRFALAVFSITIHLYWVLVSERLAWFSDVRKFRANELETKAGLCLHRAFTNLPSNLARRRGRYLSIRRLRLIFLCLLILSWVALLIWMGQV